MKHILPLMAGLMISPATHASETYDAIEPGAIDVTMVSVPQSVTPKIESKAKSLPRAAKTAPNRVKILPPTPTPEPIRVPGNRFGFDPVPESQADSITKRLTIVADLIKRHGRAYDYRGLTTQELESLRDELDRATEAPPATE